MSDRHLAGRATGALVFLLLLVSGVGAWNYHRNWQIEVESQSQRPYASYKVEDLQALRDAYSAELAGGQARFESARRNRSRPTGDVGSIAGNVQQFQKATRASAAIRAAAGDVTEGQSQLAELDRELEIRDRFGKGLQRHIKRLTTL